jgi:hypothetical protein
LDLLASDWAAPRRVDITTFRSDGRLAAQEHYNPDGSVSRTTYLYNSVDQLEEVLWTSPDGAVTSRRYSYDQDGRLVRCASVAPDGTLRDIETSTYDQYGRKTTVRSIPPDLKGAVSYGVEGSEHFYGAPGAVEMTTIMTSTTGPSKSSSATLNTNPIRRIVFTRDEHGRVIREELLLASSVPPDFRAVLDTAAPEERERMLAALRTAFGQPGTFSSITNVYDAWGRVVERIRTMGTLSEERVTYAYDGYDNRVEETSEEARRRIDADETGGLRTAEEPIRRHATRVEYQYDSHGNWTERVVSGRHEPDPDFHRSNIERRAITYFGS